LKTIVLDVLKYTRTMGDSIEKSEIIGCGGGFGKGGGKVIIRKGSYVLRTSKLKTGKERSFCFFKKSLLIGKV